MFSKRPKGATIQGKKKSGISGLLWMLLGAIITIAVGVVAYKSPIFGFNDSIKTIQSAENPDEPSVKPKVDVDTDNDYQFYDILPDQKVSSIPEPVTTAEKAEQADEKEQFKPDVVVIEKAEEKPSEIKADKETSKPQSSNAQANNAQPKNNSGNANASNDSAKPVTGDDEMVIVYENSTYDGTPVKQSSEQEASTNTTNTQQAEQGNTEGNPAKPTTSIEVTRSSKTTASAGNAEKPTPKAVITKADGADSKTTEASKKSTSYILQINSYNTASEADRRRAQVLMAGVDARVVRRSNGGVTVFQVLSNSMNSTDAVIRAQQALQKNGIDSLIVEQRRN